MDMTKRVINWKYFIGWKLFMYISFLLVYFNCFYFVRQYTRLNMEVDMLKQEVYAVNQLVETMKSEPEDSHIYAILTEIGSDYIEYDYVSYYDGFDATHIAQENGACEDVSVIDCDFPISGPILENNAEKLNKMPINEITIFRVKTGQFTDESVSRNEFSNYYATLLEEGKLEVRITYEYDKELRENVVTSVMLAY